MNFHPDNNLPGCMMPDGGDCCAGHASVVEDWHKQRLEIERLKLNHKDVVKQKHRTELRLRAALNGLQAIYTLCVALPENADLQTVLKTIHQLAGNAFDDATAHSSTECETR